MIENLLTAELRDFINNAVKDYRLPVKDGEGRAPQIINGYLPPKRSSDDDDFPFVIVRAEAGNCEREQTEITVAIIIGCYTKEYNGHEYCLNVMTRIRNALCSMENNILANKYVLQFPISWEVPQNQPWPQWQLDMTTHWDFNTPQADF
jgi:hypothetical protein